MAALRHGVKTVILPQENEKDLREIDPTVRSALNFLLVDHVDSVIDAALVQPMPELQPVQTVAEQAPVPVPQKPEKPRRKEISQ